MRVRRPVFVGEMFGKGRRKGYLRDVNDRRKGKQTLPLDLGSIELD
jgi:hypothetical protein